MYASHKVIEYAPLQAESDLKISLPTTPLYAAAPRFILPSANLFETSVELMITSWQPRAWRDMATACRAMVQ